LPFSIIVPVHNEANQVRRTAACLLAGLPTDAEIVFCCNGCTDESSAILADVAQGRALILETPEAAKAGAIRLAERHTSSFPRFYIDADVEVRGADLTRLATALIDGEAELVAPKIVYDLRGTSCAGRAIHETALSLPHLQGAAFHHVLGVSENGRRRWTDIPDISADDAFIEAHIPPELKRIVAGVEVTVRPPRTFWASVLVQERWIRGHIELSALGIDRPRSAGQLKALIRRCLAPATALPASVYLAARSAATLLSALPPRRSTRWYRDATSRR
jgi:hypothetical protein